MACKSEKKGNQTATAMGCFKGIKPTGAEEYAGNDAGDKAAGEPQPDF